MQLYTHAVKQYTEYILLTADMKKHSECDQHNTKLEMCANAQRHGRPAEYRWRPLFNSAKFG